MQAHIKNHKLHFVILSEIFAEMEKTSKRLELTDHLVSLFEQTPPDIIARIVYLIQGKLRPDYEGVELGVAEKLAIRAIAKSSGIPIGAIEDTYREYGDLGDAAAKILEQKSQTTFIVEDITVERVYETLFKIARLEGTKSQDMKMKYISSLLNDATPKEASFILKLLLGTLRLGVAENTVMDGLALAFAGDRAKRAILEKAYNVSSDLGGVAEALARKGIGGMNSFHVQTFSPIRPMLADRIKSAGESIKKTGAEIAAEYKADGERVQIHIKDKEVILFSRSLENITKYYPDIVENIPGLLRTREAVLEAEAVAINEDTGDFLPFQDLMHRRRKYKIEKAVSDYPITVNFFDILMADGKSCLEMPYSERRKLLEDVVIQDSFARTIPMMITSDKDKIEDFMENSINAGCEGLMLKQLDATYQAGSRGKLWLKLKREYRNELGDSLDLVVIGAFTGKGRRTGKYGTLLLATYDDETDTFPSICKVGTGFTDEDLDRFYQLLSDRVVLKKNPRIKSSMEADVWFEPEIVIEIVASEITLSPIHKSAMNSIRNGSGMALRFPKFTGKIRMEKMPEDASTDSEVIALYRGQKKIVRDSNNDAPY